jgi:hypothetical protein
VRTIFRLTDSGRTIFLQVVSDIVAQPRREYPYFAAGLMFMHHLEAPTAAQLLEQRAQALQAVITKLSHILDELLTGGHTRLTLVELEHKIAMIGAERDWVRKIAKEINEGKLEWKVGIDSGHEALRRKHGPSAN